MRTHYAVKELPLPSFAIRCIRLRHGASTHHCKERRDPPSFMQFAAKTLQSGASTSLHIIVPPFLIWINLEFVAKKKRHGTSTSLHMIKPLPIPFKKTNSAQKMMRLDASALLCIIESPLYFEQILNSLQKNAARGAYPRRCMSLHHYTSLALIHSQWYPWIAHKKQKIKRSFARRYIPPTTT